MSRSDWSLLALNTAALVLAFLGFASTHHDALMLAALAAMVAAVVNGVSVIRRSRPPVRVVPAAKAQDGWWESIDAHKVLDLDGRLDALERAEMSRQPADAVPAVREAARRPARSSV